MDGTRGRIGMYRVMAVTGGAGPGVGAVGMVRG